MAGGKYRTALGTVRFYRSVELSKSLPVQAVLRFIKQPQGCAAGHDPGELGTLRLSGRKQADWDIDEIFERESADRLGQLRALPEGESAGKR